MKARANVLLGFGLVIIIFGLLFQFYGYNNTWELWNIPTMSPHFADLRVITAGAEAYAQGYDPMTNNPGDPWQRRLNYPRVWQGLILIGIQESHTSYIGVCFILLFIIGVCLFLPHISNTEVLFIMAAVLSPATLLGIERGNTDLLMFFILAVSVVLVKKRHVLSMIMVLLGFVLKLFPFLGMIVLLRKKKAIFLTSISTSIVFILLYTFFTFEDMLLINKVTPRSTEISYGLNVFWMKVMSISPGIGIYARFLSYLIIFLAILYAFTAVLRHDLPQLNQEEFIHLDSFRVGSAIYVGTFLIGNNWDYRLMFLIFTIPQLLSWAKCTSLHIAKFSRITSLGIYVSLWYLLIDKIAHYLPNGYYMSFMLNEASNWIVFIGLLYLLSLSLPAWVKQYAWNLHSIIQD